MRTCKVVQILYRTVHNICVSAWWHFYKCIHHVQGYAPNAQSGMPPPGSGSGAPSQAKPSPPPGSGPPTSSSGAPGGAPPPPPNRSPYPPPGGQYPPPPHRPMYPPGITQPLPIIQCVGSDKIFCGSGYDFSRHAGSGSGSKNGIPVFFTVLKCFTYFLSV